MKKATLITGACTNTGVDIVEKFASEGHNIIFTGRSAEKVADKEAEYRKSYPPLEIIGCPLESHTEEQTVNEEECLKRPYVEHNLRHYTGALTDIRPAKTEFYF